MSVRNHVTRFVAGGSRKKSYVDVESQDWVLPAGPLQARHLRVQFVLRDILALALASVVALGLVAGLLLAMRLVGRLGILLRLVVGLVLALRRLRVVMALRGLEALVGEGGRAALAGLVGKRLLGCGGMGIVVGRLRREGL